MIKFLKDNKGGGAAGIKSLFVMLFMLMLIAAILDGLYITTAYFYIKTQMDISNRAVYGVIDEDKLADRIFHIDENLGEQKFYEYLRKNLELDNNLVLLNNRFNLSGPIKILGFKVYNDTDLPTTTPVGTYVYNVSVHSRVEVKIKPIFYGWFGEVTLRPYIDTDLPDQLLKTYSPI